MLGDTSVGVKQFIGSSLKFFSISEAQGSAEPGSDFTHLKRQPITFVVAGGMMPFPS